MKKSEEKLLTYLNCHKVISAQKGALNKPRINGIIESVMGAVKKEEEEAVEVAIQLYRDRANMLSDKLMNLELYVSNLKQAAAAFVEFIAINQLPDECFMSEIMASKEFKALKKLTEGEGE